VIPLAAISPRLIAAVVIGGSLVAAGWLARGHIATGQIARIRAEQAEQLAQAQTAARQAVEAARAREHDIIDKTEAIAREARETVEALRADAAAAVVAADSLRDAAARYAARRCPPPAGAAPGRGAPAGVPGSMHDADRLLRVLAESDAAAGALAEHADRARAAGLACERAYQAAVDALK
jgi:DNA-binding protein H-NS